VIRRVPVARGHNELEAGVGGELVHALGDVVTLRHGERSAGGEVVLEVDYDQGLCHRLR
jgi:hypothetical protein